MPFTQGFYILTVFGDANSNFWSQSFQLPPVANKQLQLLDPKGLFPCCFYGV